MTNHSLWARIEGPDPNLRAADADRERIAERLRTSHAEGRLETAELQDRIERCYQAKTLGELSALVKDLPRPDDRNELRPAGWFPPWRWSLPPLLPILVALAVISAATGHHHHLVWLWIPIVFLFWRMRWWRHHSRLTAARRGGNDWT
jgi:Domain of unknown function (DUF1707)